MGTESDRRGTATPELWISPMAVWTGGVQSQAEHPLPGPDVQEGRGRRPQPCHHMHARTLKVDFGDQHLRRCYGLGRWPSTSCQAATRCRCGRRRNRSSTIEVPTGPLTLPYLRNYKTVIRPPLWTALWTTSEMCTTGPRGSVAQEAVQLFESEAVPIAR